MGDSRKRGRRLAVQPPKLTNRQPELNAKGEKSELSKRALKFGDVPREHFADLRDRIGYLESELTKLDNPSE